MWSSVGSGGGVQAGAEPSAWTTSTQLQEAARCSRTDGQSLILALPRAHRVALGPQLPSCGMGVMVSAPVFVRTE